MKRALAIFILLSVAMIPKHACPEMGRTAFYKTVGDLSKIGLSFAKHFDVLNDIGHTIDEIGDAISDQKKLETVVFAHCRIHSAKFVCRTTADILSVALSIKLNHSDGYYELLRGHFEYGKEYLKRDYKGLKDVYPYIENKAALYNLDKAKEVIGESLRLYGKALALLPPEK